MSLSTARPNIQINMTTSDPTSEPNPANLVSPLNGATNILLSQTLNWSSGGGSPTDYKIFWGISETSFENEQSGLTTTSFSPPNLEYSTTYYWKVDPHNDYGYASDIATLPVWSFTTMADPTINPPFTEGFEHSGALPNGWSVTHGSGGSKNWECVTTDSHGASSAHSDSYFARLDVYNASTSYNFYCLITPPIDLSSGNIRLNYWVWIGSTGSSTPLDIEISIDNMATWNVLYQHTLTTTNTWFNNTIALTDYASSGAYIRFKGKSNYGSGSCNMGLDDITFEPIPTIPFFSYSPTSLPFGAALVNSPTAYQNVTITNTGGGVLNLAEVDVSIIGTYPSMFSFDPVNLGAELGPNQSVTIPVRYNPTAIGEHSATLQMVYNATNYEVALSGNSLSEHALYESFESDTFPPVCWSNPGSWSRSTSYAKQGVASAYKYPYDTSKYILSTPKVTITDTSTLNLWTLCSSTSGTIEVIYSPDRTTWTQIGRNITHSATNTWYNTIVDLSSLAGNNYYLGVRTGGQSYTSYYIDLVIGPDITPEAPGAPTLTAPSNGATLVSILPTFTWTAPTTGGIPTGYKVYCDNNNPPTSEIADVTGLTFTATVPLLNETQYYWTVKAYNTAGDTAATPVSFTTVEQGYTVIGTGTSTQRQPFSTLWGYERSAALYTNAQIGGFGLLDKVAWNCATTSTTAVPYKIYVMQTDGTAFTAMSWDTFTASATLIDEGTHTFSTTGWNLFELDNPFSYVLGNLIVAVETNYGGSGGGSGHTFYYSTGAASSHQYWNQDSTPPTGNGTVNTNLPNIMLHLSELPTNPTINITPTSWDFGQVQINTTNTKDFTISNIGGGTLTINPAIELIGTNVDQFLLTDTNSYPCELGSGEAMTVSVAFAPTSIGEKTVNLKIVDNLSKTEHNIPLTGTGADYSISSIPYLNDFQSNINGWTVLNVNDDENEWERLTESASNMAMQISYNSSEAMNDWFITPPINLTKDITYYIKYEYRVASDYFPENLGVYIGNSPTPAALTTLLDDQSPLTNEEFEIGTASFTPPATGIYYIGFYGYSDADMDILYVDNFRITLAGSDIVSGITFGGTANPDPAPIDNPVTGNPLDTSLTIEGIAGTPVITVITEWAPPAVQLPNVGLSFVLSGTNFSGTTITINHNLGFVPEQIAYRIEPGTWNILTAGSQGVDLWNDTSVTFNLPSTKSAGDLGFVFPQQEGQTLPVTLSNFTAVVTSENFVNIAWLAETETNHSGYNILRNEAKDLENAIKINAQLIDQGTAAGTQISYFYTDFEVYTNQVYYYWLESIALDGTNQFYGPLTVTIGDPTQEPLPPVVPMVTKLYNAFPNPFNPNTNIRYSLKEAGKVKIEIYNMKGQKIKSYNQEHSSPGYYQVSWDGRDENGRNVASGIYLYRLTTANYTSAKKMVLAK